MIRQTLIASVAVVVLSIGPSLPAQTEPATVPAAESTEHMQVLITDVQGTVRVRENHDAAWQPATVNMVVGENAEFRTGPRSTVTCVIPPDQTFTLDRLGTMSVLEAVKDGKTVKTDLALKYGRVRYDIEAAGVQHQAVIRSPSSTLAVRGTRVSLYDQPPFAPQAQSFIGRAIFGYAKHAVPVGGKSFARVTAGSTGAADTALSEFTIDPRSALARSETDQRLIDQEVSRGAVLSYDPIAKINVISGGAGPLPDNSFSQNPPGALNFYLRWTGNADLNLTVTLEKAADPDALLLTGNFQPTEVLYPGYSLNNTASGGHMAFDNRGGPKGGDEVGYWNKLVPGLYGISARNISGDTADFKFNVVESSGSKQTPITIYTEELTKGKQIERSLPQGQEIVGIVLVPPSPLLESIIPDDPGPGNSGAAPSAVQKVSSLSKTSSFVGPVAPVAVPSASSFVGPHR